MANKKKNRAKKVDAEIVEKDVPVVKSSETDGEGLSGEDFTASVTKLADATGIIEIPGEMLDGNEKKPSVKKDKSEKKQRKFDISELDDQVKEIIDDALDENTDDLGITDEAVNQESSVSFSQALTIAFGVILLAFAIVGMIFTGHQIKTYVDAKNDNSKLISSFERLVIPLAASDTPTFDDVSSLNRDVLLTAACWDIILSPSATYNVENGYYKISYLELDQRITMLFGKGLQYEHGTVGDEELMFSYDQSTGMYKIPCAPRLIAYYPKVDSIEQTQDGYKLSVSYRTPVTNWISSDTSAEKIMICNVKKSDIGYTISSFEVGEIINEQGL